MSASASTAQYCSFPFSTSVNVVGGTPPYTISVSWYSVNMFITSSTVSGTSPTASLSPPPAGSYQYGANLTKAVVSVSDAQGCTAGAISTFPAKKIIDVTHTVQLNAGTGDYTLYARFLDQGFTWVFCTGSSIYGTVNGVTASLSSAWTLLSDGSGRYRYNSPMPVGVAAVSWSASAQVNCGDTFDYLYCVGGGATLYMPPVITVGDAGGVNVWLRAALQGPMVSSGLMIDSLRAKGLVPVQEPYSGSGYTFTGVAAGLATTSAVLAVTGNNAAVDWVIVELRATTVPYGVIASRPALLQRDGDVMDVDGDGYVHFGSVAPGNYRVAVRHRNHLGAMTFSNQALVSSPAQPVNLTGGSTYGTDAVTYVGGKYCLWSGDGNGNGTLGYTGAGNDRDPILIAVGGTTPNNTLGPVYDRRDVNMDGVIRYVGANNDRDPILTNVGSTTPNNTRTQQLP